MCNNSPVKATSPAVLSELALEALRTERVGRWRRWRRRIFHLSDPQYQILELYHDYFQSKGLGGGTMGSCPTQVLTYFGDTT